MEYRPYLIWNSSVHRVLPARSLLDGRPIVVLAAACSGDKIDYVPESAKLEYDVNYSEDLKSSGIAGQFLPRKLSGNQI